MYNFIKSHYYYFILSTYIGKLQLFITLYLSISTEQFGISETKKTFAMMLFLDHFRHIENKHEQVKKGECSRCHRQFGTKNSAERHEREQKCTEKT